MNDGGYKIRNKTEIHFLTFAVVEWVDVFSRKEYRDITINSLAYCQQAKGDFKKFTSKKIVEAIVANQRESRREWMLPIFRKAGEVNSRNKDYQFWRQENQPKECFSSGFTFQKLNYIHNNPVEAGIVDRPEHYLCSSAKDYHYGKHCGLLKVDFI